MKHIVSGPFMSRCSSCENEYKYVELLYSSNLNLYKRVSHNNLNCSKSRCGVCVNRKKFCKVFFKDCSICHQIYVSKTKRSHEFCSIKCKNQHHSNYRREYYKKADLPEKNCKVCGTMFRPKNGLAVTCSTSCSAKRQHRVRPCTTCGVQFSGKKGVYCSQGCVPKYQRKIYNCLVCSIQLSSRRKYCVDHEVRTSYYKKAPLVIKDCVTCGKSFTKRSNSKYCKLGCSPFKRFRKRIEKKLSVNVKPSWLSWSEVSDFERTKPSGDYQLDHIVPLNHPSVCGLHVPWNFQWLTREENMCKSNKFDGTNENNSWRRVF